jgi:hemoglobin
MNDKAASMRRLVSRDRLKELVDGFYLDVRSDPEIGPIFDKAIGATWNAHLERMVDFWSTVLLASKSFRGNVFKKHMALETMSEAHFARWLTLWHKHTDALLPSAAAQELQQIAHGVARNLFYGHHKEFAEFIVKNGQVIDCVRYGRLPDVEPDEA